MGVKLMTGATGEQNIQAADDRECLAGITGLDSYVFPTGSQLKATLVDANTVTIGTGAGSLQGSRFRCSTTTTVNIQSGTQGQYRHDIIGLHFSRETSGREGLEFQVLTGEPAASEGAAADPAYTVGDLLKGDAEAFMPLYRVKLSGINAADPEPMFSILTPLATLGDSVSQIVERGESGIWTYTKYADGTAECYGTKNHRINRTGTYWLPEISLPFTMVKPVNSYDDFTVIVSGGTYFAPMLYPYYPTGKSSISTVGCAVADAKETGDINVGYFVRGRWK